MYPVESRLDPDNFNTIVFFTGAGMSAESGIPVYRGAGGLWEQYRWQEYACQEAFDRDPEKVLDFHEVRRRSVAECKPHTGHTLLSGIQRKHTDTWIVTQNIDGMHQRAGADNVIELHGSLWRLRCRHHGVLEDYGNNYKTRICPRCRTWLRPDIVWFEDVLDMTILRRVESLVSNVDLFVAIGISGHVYPAAVFPVLAKQAGAMTVCINTEAPRDENIFEHVCLGKASDVLEKLFSHYIH